MWRLQTTPKVSVIHGCLQRKRCSGTDAADSNATTVQAVVLRILPHRASWNNHLLKPLQPNLSGHAGAVGPARISSTPVESGWVIQFSILRHPALYLHNCFGAKHDTKRNQTRSLGRHVNSSRTSKTTEMGPGTIDFSNPQTVLASSQSPDCAIAVFRGVLDVVGLVGAIGSRLWGCLCNPARRLRPFPESSMSSYG